MVKLIRYHDINKLEAKHKCAIIIMINTIYTYDSMTRNAYLVYYISKPLKPSAQIQKLLYYDIIAISCHSPMQ